MRFEWDPEKANANVEKHGVTFEEASTAFADWDSITVPDPEHSIGEERWYLLGVSEKGNVLGVSCAASAASRSQSGAAVAADDVRRTE